VTSLRFFPSSKVLLTGGADFTLTILSADPLEISSTSPSPVRILRAHTRAITSTAIIARGRNVLSSAKDGTVRLWDVSGGEQIRSLTAGTGKYVPVNGISVGKRINEVGRVQPDGEELSFARGAEKDPREVETADKVVWCALHDGSMEAFDLASKKSIHHQKSSLANGSLSAITFCEENSLLATGSSTGAVRVYDVRALRSPVCSFKRNGATIEDLAFMNYGDEHAGLAIATEDGLPFIASVKSDGLEVVAELIGGDCDGLRSVRASGSDHDVWTAGDDGIVRKYSLLK
jgi:proteasomal ATPase-associated factor 1